MRVLHDVSAETRHVLQRLSTNAVRGGEERRTCGAVRTSTLASPPTRPAAAEHLDSTVWKVAVVVFLGLLMTPTGLSTRICAMTDPPVAVILQ